MCLFLGEYFLMYFSLIYPCHLYSFFLSISICKKQTLKISLCNDRTSSISHQYLSSSIYGPATLFSIFSIPFNLLTLIKVRLPQYVPLILNCAHEYAFLVTISSTYMLIDGLHFLISFFLHQSTY